jgi:hypothetical protein
MKRQKNGFWKLTDSEMNNICCIMNVGEERYRELNYPALAESTKELSDEIYNILNSVGYYNNSK